MSKTIPSVNIYDFDNTIYDGDATLDFYIFCLKRRKILIVLLPYQFFSFILFKLKIYSRKKFKEDFFIFLRHIKYLDEYVEVFWSINNKKIKDFYKKKSSRKNDIIISASPDFLLGYIATEFKILQLIATNMDKKTGKIFGENCYGEEKLNRLYSFMPNASIDNAYTDHMSDAPLLKLAKNAYLVKGDLIEKL